jgi:hypothetical protein
LADGRSKKTGGDEIADGRRPQHRHGTKNGSNIKKAAALVAKELWRPVKRWN